MSEPTVSVIIPCFNGEKTIGETLEVYRDRPFLIGRPLLLMTVQQIIQLKLYTNIASGIPESAGLTRIIRE